MGGNHLPIVSHGRGCYNGQEHLISILVTDFFLVENSEVQHFLTLKVGFHNKKSITKTKVT